MNRHSNNLELVEIYKKESENIYNNVKSKEINTFTKLTDMKKAESKSQNLFHYGIKRASVITNPFAFT